MGCFTDPHVFEFEEAKGQSEGAPSPGYCAASRTELPPGRPLASAALPEKRKKKGGLTENTTQGGQKKNQQEAIFSHTHIFHSAYRRGSVQSESLGLIM